MGDALGNTEPIIEGGREIRYRWWIEPMANRDVYALRAMRYEFDIEEEVDPGNRTRTASFHLSYEGRWVYVDEGQTLPEPTMVLSGQLLHTLSQTGLELHRPQISDGLLAFVTRILSSMAAPKEDEE